MQDLNLRLRPCEERTLATELIARSLGGVAAEMCCLADAAAGVKVHTVGGRLLAGASSNLGAVVDGVTRCGGFTASGSTVRLEVVVTSSSSPLHPFLNSVTVLPRLRPMSGSLRPNNSTPSSNRTI